MDKLVKIATESVQMAGKYLQACQKASEKDIISSDGKDIKLKHDIESQNIIINNLNKYSNYPILSEEDNSITFEEIKKNNYYWILDPLDGTFNYLRSIPLCCLSLALWSKKGPELGVIYDFISHNLYQAVVGEYCVINGKKSTVSTVDKINNAVICSGLPSMRSFTEESLLRSVIALKEFKKVRFIGTAALSLAWLSFGLIDVYAEENIFIWDVAAGLALVKASGGDYYFETSKTNSNLMNVIATNGQIKIEDLKKQLSFNV